MKIMLINLYFSLQASGNIVQSNNSIKTNKEFDHRISNWIKQTAVKTINYLSYTPYVEKYTF